MSLVEEPRTTDQDTAGADSPSATSEYPEEPEEPTSSGPEAASSQPSDEAGTVTDEPRRRFPLRGMRIGRLRIRSVAKVAAVFLTLGYLVVLASSVAVWTVLVRLGFVDDVEELVTSSLGVDSFDIAGRDLFDLLVVGTGVVFAMSFVIVLLLTLVYNATCFLFGGIAVETTPVRGWRRFRRNAQS